MWFSFGWYIMNCDYDYLAIHDVAAVQRKVDDRNYLKLQRKQFDARRQAKLSNGKGHMMFRRNAVRNK